MPEEAAQKLFHLVKERLPRQFELNPVRDIQVYLVVLIGQRRALAIAVKGKPTRRRWSKLRAWLTRWRHGAASCKPMRCVTSHRCHPLHEPPRSLMIDSAPTEPQRPALLSEASLLGSAPTDYMNSEQLEFFRQRLLSQKTEIARNALAMTEQLREVDAPSDDADRATLEEERTLALRVRDREHKLLGKIDAALLRIEDGSYGYCEETGEPIGLPRLLARPTATLTIEAQERRERRQKLFAS